MTRFARLAWGAALLTLVPAAADAQLAPLAFPSRTSSTLIETNAKDFADAKATITATTQVAPGAVGGRGLNLDASINIVSLGTRSTGDIGVSAAITKQFPQYGVSQIDGSVAATGPGGGSFSLIESYGHDTAPFGYGPLYRYADGSVYQDRQDYGFLPPFTQTGLPSLEFFLPIGGGGLVDQGGTFIAELLIAGDYSSTAGLDSGTGQHFLANINPAWQVTSDFLYDPATNLTTFRAVNPSYDYDNSDAAVLDLDLFLFGAPGAVAAVPEPATWAAMILGFLLVGTLLRRRGAAGSGAATAPA